MNSPSQSTGWHKFGIVMAWLIGAIACGFGLYAMGRSIHDIGYDSGKQVGVEIMRQDLHPIIQLANKELAIARVYATANMALVKRLDTHPLPQNVGQITVCVDTTYPYSASPEYHVSYSVGSCSVGRAAVVYEVSYDGYDRRIISNPSVDPNMVPVPNPLASR